MTATRSDSGNASALDRRVPREALPPWPLLPAPDPPVWRERLRELHRTGEFWRRLLLAAPLAAVAFAILAFGGVYGWAYGIAYLLLYAALASWAILCLRGRFPLQGDRLYLPLLLFGGYVTLSYALRWTLVPGSTLTALLHLAPAAVAFFLITQLFQPDRDAHWVLMSLAAFTGVLALLAIAQIFTAGGAIYWHFRYTYASPAGPYVNRNHFAGCMELLVPLASLPAFLCRRGWLATLAWAALPALGVAAVVLAASRGGAAALLVESVAALAAVLLAGPRRGRDRFRAAALLLAVAIAAIALVGSGSLQARLSSTNLTVDTNVAARQQLNRSSLAMWRAHPLRGWGLGTWGEVYPAFARFDDFHVYEFAHNDYLQLLAETGLIGFALVALFWMLWAARLAHRLRQPSRASAPAAALLALAAAIGILGLLIHSWVDFNLHIPANLLLLLLTAALGAAACQDREAIETHSVSHQQAPV